MEDERDDEAAEEEPDDQDEEEDDTQSVKTYAKASFPSMMMIKQIPMPLRHPKVIYNYALYFGPMSC